MWSAATHIGFRPDLHVCLWMWMQLNQCKFCLWQTPQWSRDILLTFYKARCILIFDLQEKQLQIRIHWKAREPLLFSVWTVLTFVPLSPQFLKSHFLHESPEFARSSAVHPVGSSHPPGFAPSSGHGCPLPAIKKCFFTSTESLWFCFPEIPLVLYLFALISITWLWGGLHMAYRHLWMLVFFIIFNSLQVRAATASFCSADIWCLGWAKCRNSGLRVPHYKC